MFGSSSGLGLRPFTAATRVRVPYRMPQCLGGEIGRHKGLKIPRSQECAGSSPALGTNFIKRL